MGSYAMGKVRGQMARCSQSGRSRCFYFIITQWWKFQILPIVSRPREKISACFVLEIVPSAAGITGFMAPLSSTLPPLHSEEMETTTG